MSSQHRYIRGWDGMRMYLRQAQQTVSSRLVVAQTLMTSLSLIRIPIVAAAVSTGAPLHLTATVPPPRSTCREQQVDNPLENAEGDHLCSPIDVFLIVSLDRSNSRSRECFVQFFITFPRPGTASGRNSRWKRITRAEDTCVLIIHRRATGLRHG